MNHLKHSASFLLTGCAILWSLVLGGCMGSALPPVSTPETPGPTLEHTEGSNTSVPPDAVLPDPTALSSRIPTDLPTPTEIPVGEPGRAGGTVLWNNKPAADVTVRLCQEIIRNGCQEPFYAAVSGQDGRYTITGVPPGTYAISTQMNGEGIEVPWQEVSVQVAPGEEASAPNLNVYRHDVQLSSPTNYELTKNVTPSLAWQAYPEASYYKLLLLHDHAHAFLDYMVITVTSYSFTTPQQTGDYDWLVEAYNNQDIKIAVSPTWYFTVEP